MKKFFIITLLLSSSLPGQFKQMNAGELQLAVNKLSVLGSVLYVAAHPDDENTALLSYFAEGKLYSTAYLAVTRGEGGQNLLGSEQGTELGLIRTEELLDARRIDGARQFFTRAIDFGFSKSSEEALRLWNKDSVLKDVVWVIRKFQPDIIITRFSPTLGGHGHHLASAILAQEAFTISGDPNVFPEQLQFVKPWKAKRILFNQFRFGGMNSNPENLPTIKIDAGVYNPLLGKSYTEIAGISRTMHKSQSMGSPQNKGTNINEFTVTEGDPAQNDLMEGVNTTWKRLKGTKNIEEQIHSIQKSFSLQDPSKSVPALVKLYGALHGIGQDAWVMRKQKEVLALIQNCLGLWIEVDAKKYSYSPGSAVEANALMINRSSRNVQVASITVPALNVALSPMKELKLNEPVSVPISGTIPESFPLTQPYWLEQTPSSFRYSVGDQEKIGDPENDPPLSADVVLAVEHEIFHLAVPVQYKWVDDLRGELRRNVDIVPPVSVSLSEKNIIGRNDGHSLMAVQVRALRDTVSGMIDVSVPKGWSASKPQRIALSKTGDEGTFQFYLTADSSAESGTFTASVDLNGKKYSSTVKTISYPHIAPQTLLEPSEGKLLKMDLQKQGKNIGYIMGAGDQVPAALQQMGYTVSLLSDDDLRKGDFQQYDAIVAGVRSYNTREQLRLSNENLLKYAFEGGTYIVQYQTVIKGETDNIAPFPMELSRDRVTDENAAVSFVDAMHPLLNRPNKISQKDFEGWVQERGLYFARTWDKRFEPVLSCADPNEKPTAGSLLAARYGKGYYIFTGLAFFRQLPAGVEGAYRLFANMISIGK